MPRRHHEKKPCSTADFFEAQISKLDLTLKEHTILGINQAIQRLTFLNDGEQHELIDSDIIADNSYKSYTKQFRGFFKFLALIGDYDSMLVFHNHKEKDVVESIVAESVALYIIYKTKKSTEKLTKLHNKTIMMKDVFGQEIMCRGDWNYTGNADQFLNAITNIQRSIKQSKAEYTDKCQHCINAWQSNSNSTGCRYHIGELKLYRRGNPRYSDVVTKALSIAKEETQDHRSRKCAQLLPSEVETLRKFLFSTNKIADYQLYVMMLLGIHMFLRFDEVAYFSFTQFLPEFTVVRSDGYVEKMLFKVKGKADKHYVYLSLKRNDEFAQLCPVRHLLFYLHVTGIKEGFIFPDLIRKKDKYDYKLFNNMMKDLIKDQLGKTERISTHFLRNTGYLFAKFGEGTFEVIQRAARHKSTTTAVGYYSDAETLFNSFKGTEAALMNKVPKWHDLWVNNTESYRTMHSGRVYTLEQLANMFTQDIFGRHNTILPNDNSKFFNLVKLLDLLTRKRGNITLLEAMKEDLQSEGANSQIVDIAVNYFLKAKGSQHNNPSEVLGTDGLIDQVTGQQFNAAVRLNNDALEQDPETESRSTEAEICPTKDAKRMVTRKRRRKNGSEEIEGRQRLRTIPTKERLSVLLDLYDKNEAKSKNALTGGARTFFYNVLKPVHDCFQNHFQSDAVSFYGKYSLSDYSRFKKLCCTGVGECCNLKFT